MNFDEYQEKTNKTAIYPKDNIDGLDYLGLGLTGEAGEVSNMIKKLIRDKNGKIDNNFIHGLRWELGDLIWYVAQICEVVPGLSFDSVAQYNIDKLLDRKKRGKLRGKGDKR